MAGAFLVAVALAGPLLAAESVLRGRGTVGASIPRVSAAGVLAELAARTPDVQLRFDRIEITLGKKPG